MNDWRLPLEDEEMPPERWRNLPAPAMARVTGPEHYVPHEALIDAINTALALGQPLLVTGEPGCGKTELGDYIAWKLGLGRALRFDAKTDMQARDLFYTFDTVARFHAAQDREASVAPVRFITYNALGEAIIRASKPGIYAKWLPQEFEHKEQRRSVVLIDEIDKAPRDVPNDLLAEMVEPRFRIPELQNVTIRAEEAFRPILVLTSNSEKALPEAFLRRCIYYHMPFPNPNTLRTIVASRIVDLPPNSNLVGDSIAVVQHLWEKRSLRKRPGTAELLGFLLALRSIGFTPTSRLPDDPRWVTPAKVTLFKMRDDQERADAHLDGIAWPAAVVG